MLVTAHSPAPSASLAVAAQWKYPSMVKVAELTGHTARVLHMAQSPDGKTVVSAAADETLRFWRILDSDGGRHRASRSDGLLSPSAWSGA